MSELVKLDTTALEAKILELEAKVNRLQQTQMPDDIKQKLTDVLNWIIASST